jgi:threonine aldolase
MRQAGVLAAAGLVALDGGRERLVEDHARARRLAEAFAGMRGLAVDVAATRTNILMVDCGGAPRAARIRDELAARGVLAIVLGGRIRFVTHRDVGDADVERAIAAMPEAAAAAAA